jgi:hypothetical protein
MGLRITRRIRIVLYVFAGLALASFALSVLFEVVRGNSLGTYRSYGLVEWNYGGALIFLIALGVVGLAGVLIRLYERWRGLR